MSVKPSSTVWAGSQPDELLTLRLVESGPVSVIEVAGECDMANAHLLVELGEFVLDTWSPLVLVLDLARLRFCCTDVLRALLGIRDMAAAEATRLIVRNPSPVTVRVLALSGMLTMFEIKNG